MPSNEIKKPELSELIKLISNPLPEKVFKDFVQFYVAVACKKIYRGRISEQDFLEFEPTKQEIRFERFFYEWRALFSSDVPYELWQDIAYDAVMLVKEFVEQKPKTWSAIDRMPGFEAFDKKCNERIDQFRKDPQHCRYFNDYLGGW